MINAPLDQVFQFFSEAQNLNRLTPESLKFKILTPLPIEMKAGTKIDYSITLNGIPMRWQTLISKWEAGKEFVDEQIKGPYKVWHHTHRFFSEGNKTYMVDEVEYLCPGWILEPLIHRLVVKKKVNEIFDFREKIIQEIFNAS